MAERLEEIQIQFQKRNARKRGPTSSDQFNDTIEEIAHDFAEFNTQWNDLLIPLTAQLPDGSEGLIASAVDAFVDGLDGKTVFTDSRATSVLNTLYFNTAAERPNTIFEQLDDVYTTINLTREDLENQISNKILTASQISVIDDAALYSSVNVEDALEEVMIRANIAVSATALDLQYSSVTYTVSNTAQAGLHTVFNTGTNGGTVVVNAFNGITFNSGTGEFTILNTGTYKIDIAAYLLQSTEATADVLRLNKNNGTIVWDTGGNLALPSGFPGLVSVSVILDFTAADVIEFEADSDGADTIQTIQGSTFNITKIA